MAETIRIRVGDGGRIKAVHHDALSWRSLGAVSIQRGSHVEPDRNGDWMADLSPVGGPLLGPFGKRGAALAAEVAWLGRHWLPASRTFTNEGTTDGSDT